MVRAGLSRYTEITSNSFEKMSRKLVEDPNLLDAIVGAVASTESYRSWIAHCLRQSRRNLSPNGLTALSYATNLTGLLFDDAGHDSISGH